MLWDTTLSIRLPRIRMLWDPDTTTPENYTINSKAFGLGIHIPLLRATRPLPTGGLIDVPNHARACG